MSDDSIEKLCKSMMDEIHELRQLRKDIREGKVSDSEFKKRMAEYDRSYKVGSKRLGEITKEIEEEERTKNK